MLVVFMFLPLDKVQQHFMARLLLVCQDRVQHRSVELVLCVLKIFSGEGSTALRGRGFAGQVFSVPDAAGRDGFTESLTGQAEMD